VYEYGQYDPIYPENHHLIPLQYEDRLPPGMNIDDYTVTLFSFQHDALHSDGWNCDWGDFLAAYSPNNPAPQDEVLTHMYELMNQYGIGDATVHNYYAGQEWDHLEWQFK
jgi:hypothetical protein